MFCGYPFFITASSVESVSSFLLTLLYNIAVHSNTIQKIIVITCIFDKGKTQIHKRSWNIPPISSPCYQENQDRFKPPDVFKINYRQGIDHYWHELTVGC